MLCLGIAENCRFSLWPEKGLQMASFSEVGLRPISPLDLESLHVDLNDPCRAAFTSVHNYFLGRYFLVHMAEKISVARETTELGLFCHVGSLKWLENWIRSKNCRELVFPFPLGQDTLDSALEGSQ